MKRIKSRHERRQEWKSTKKNFTNKEDWRKSWENYKVGGKQKGKNL